MLNEDSFINTLKPRQNGRHFPDDNFKCTFLNENVSISIDISLTFLWTIFQQAISHYLNQCWHRLPAHICVTRSQWVNFQRNWQENVSKYVGRQRFFCWRPVTARCWQPISATLQSCAKHAKPSIYASTITAKLGSCTRTWLTTKRNDTI